MVIPAVMYVVSRSCPDDLDPEVWLDRVFSSMSAVTGTRWYLLARAETARWRDDEEAESLWSGRSERLFGLLEDDPSAFIADLAGL